MSLCVYLYFFDCLIVCLVVCLFVCFDGWLFVRTFISGLVVLNAMYVCTECVYYVIYVMYVMCAMYVMYVCMQCM